MRWKLFPLAVVGALTTTIMISGDPLARASAAGQIRVADEPVDASDWFVFYSRFEMNLHDRLVRWALPEDTSGSDCVSGLPEADRQAWHGSVEKYQQVFRSEDRRRASIRVRFELLGVGPDVEDVLGSMPEAIAEALDAAAPAYRTCWWRDDDQANRRWIANVARQVDDLEEELAARLQEAYQTEWDPPPIPVDVMPYVSRQGANTVVGPHHIVVNSSEESYQDRAAIEMLFHEASHTIIGGRSGEPTRQLRVAAERLGVDVPRDLWHVLLFYTTGMTTRKLIEEKVGEVYEPYLYARDLFDRGWAELREPVEIWWTRYLEGEIEMAEAAEGLLRAISEAQ